MGKVDDMLRRKDAENYSTFVSNEIQKYNTLVDSINSFIPTLVQAIENNPPPYHQWVRVDDSEIAGWALLFNENNDSDKTNYCCWISAEGQFLVLAGSSDAKKCWGRPNDNHKIMTLHRIQDYNEDHFGDSGCLVGMLYALNQFYLQVLHHGQ